MGLPLFTLGIIAQNYLIERRKVLENQTAHDTEKALQLFDSRMPLVLAEVMKDLERRILAPLPANTDPVSILVSRIEKTLLIHPDISGLWIANPNGESVMENRTKISRETKLIIKSAKNTIKSIFASLNQLPFNAEDTRKDKISQIAALGDIDIDGFFSTLICSVGRFNEYKVGVSKGVQGIFPVRDLHGIARYLIIYTNSRDNLESIYVSKHLFPAARQLNDTMFFAISRAPVNPDSFPRPFKYIHLIRPSLTKLRVKAHQVKARRKVGNTTYLISGIRGNELNFHLLAVTSDRLIRQEEEETMWFLKFAGLAITLITLTIGNFLARKFLDPVRHLANGVEAISNRKFEIRLPVLDQDELGDLASVFNSMMEGLADLEVAKLVQEILFPQDVLSTEGFEFYGRCSPASQVGGDYFDYFRISEDRVVVLIGDVSGHGVSAAMGMTMAKAIVAHPSNNFDPAQTLTVLNQVICSTMKRKKIMTCFFALIDLKKRQITFSNAGHLDPYLVNNKTATPVVQRGLLLGGSLRTKYTNVTLDLEPSDLVVLYTDGVVESLISTDQPIGFERMEAALPGLVRDTVKETEKAIRHWHASLIMPGPQADDITLVLIKVKQPSS
ncbi:MAG: SpoIIE family protein phosphatase [Candidatus Riflebacteria bacterium]|nr:SpoIIE family protein phosphatase [Candidatus Riflebacteria bacterium]